MVIKTEAQFNIVVCKNIEKDIKKVIKEIGNDDINIITYDTACIYTKNEKINYEKWWNNLNLSTENTVFIQTKSCGIGRYLENDIKDYSKYFMNNCLSFCLDDSSIEKYVKEKKYVVTGGWISRWKENIKKQGFIKENAKLFYQSFANEILVLDSNTQDDLKEKSEEFSKFVEIPYVIEPISLDKLVLIVKSLLYEWYIKKEVEYRKEKAEYEMLLHMISNISNLIEEDIIENMIGLFHALFAPESIIYHKDIPKHLGYIKDDNISSDIIREKNGLIIILKIQTTIYGIIELKNFMYIEYIDRYIESINNIIGIFCLAIVNARRHEKLGELARLDGLTGINNRRVFDDVLEKEWYRCLRNKKELSILMIDIDWFKNYNDNYGHLEGDKCLIRIANKLKEIVTRNSDIVARYGGEEFVVLLPETSKKGAAQVAEKLRKSIEELNIKNELSSILNYVTISIGVATLLPSNQNSLSLLSLADQALYKAKELGKNRVVNSKEK